MIETITHKLRACSLNEVRPFVLKVTRLCSGDSDSEEENQELAQIDRERRKLRCLPCRPTGADLSQRTTHYKELLQPSAECQNRLGLLEDRAVPAVPAACGWQERRAPRCYHTWPQAGGRPGGRCSLVAARAWAGWDPHRGVPAAFQPLRQQHPCRAAAAAAAAARTLATAPDPPLAAFLQPEARGGSGGNAGGGDGGAVVVVRRPHATLADPARRPSLNFEKMQQSVGGGLSCPRDPAMFAFRPLASPADVLGCSPAVPGSTAAPDP
ncbi:uncharacterized protein LOC116947880 isoform X1 [Petromyzon marinus]|uniref:uncharacterized protein LOC116947880 isoform X1 n=1 Tax=Petromyzon marinus TaxID=7757 RepID=UPI003F706859